jgi:hypothetical protein
VSTQDADTVGKPVKTSRNRGHTEGHPHRGELSPPPSRSTRMSNAVSSLPGAFMAAPDRLCCLQPLAWVDSVLWVRAGAEVASFPSACFYVIRNYGEVNIR